MLLDQDLRSLARITHQTKFKLAMRKTSTRRPFVSQPKRSIDGIRKLPCALTYITQRPASDGRRSSSFVLASSSNFSACSPPRVLLNCAPLTMSRANMLCRR